jgi:hypothetical protein
MNAVQAVTLGSDRLIAIFGARLRGETARTVAGAA